MIRVEAYIQGSSMEILSYVPEIFFIKIVRHRSQTLVRGGGPDAKNIYRENFSGPPSDCNKISGPPFLP